MFGIYIYTLILSNFYSHNREMAFYHELIYENSIKRKGHKKINLARYVKQKGQNVELNHGQAL